MLKTNITNIIKKYFSDKTDKGGHPYYDHLYNVASQAKIIADILGYSSFEANQVYIAGLLHDIFEDTKCTEQELIDAGCSKEIIDLVKVVTRKPEEEYYFDFIKRVSKNQLAKIIKIADLENNMDIKRLKTFEDHDMKRLKKYWYSWKYLYNEISENEANKKIGKIK